MGVQVPSEPITRKEQYLAKAAGQAVEIPAEPITREEAYLNAIAQGGGGGGTSDYNQLSNKPQIAGVTLSGDKSLADLGIASATTVSGILDGTDIDSFGDVETALGDKVDKVNGKGLSTNDYDDTEKAAVAAATTAIAGIKDGTTIDSFGDVETALGAIQDGQSIDSFADVESAIGAIEDGTTIDSFADVETALAGKQDTLTFDNTPTENSTNPVKSGGIYSALAGKADTGIVADDFDSTASYVIGNYCIENGKLYKFKANHSGAWSASDVDEIQITGELATLKSGLTNVNVALSVPEGSGKNVLLMTIDRLKKSNTTGTWAGNVYTVGYNTYTVSVDDNGVVTSIEGTSTNIDSSAIKLDFDLKAGSYILSSGFVELFGANDTFLQKDGVTIARGNNSSPGQNFTLSEDSELTWFFRVTNITKTSYPMIRPAFITDSTFAPYIPSVESRIEAVESGLTNKQNKTDNTLQTTDKTIVGGINELKSGLTNLVKADDTEVYTGTTQYEGMYYVDTNIKDADNNNITMSRLVDIALVVNNNYPSYAVWINGTTIRVYCGHSETKVIIFYKYI